MSFSVIVLNQNWLSSSWFLPRTWEATVEVFLLGGCALDAALDDGAWRVSAECLCIISLAKGGLGATGTNSPIEYEDCADRSG